MNNQSIENSLTKLILSICLYGVGILSLGCVEPPSTEITYGAEIDPVMITSALQEALGKSDSPANFRLNEVALSALTRSIRGRTRIDLLNTSEVTIVEKIESPTQWQIKEVEILKNFDPLDPNQDPTPLVREDHKCWNKTNMQPDACEFIPPASAPSTSQNTLFISGVVTPLERKLKPFLFFANETDQTEKQVTFHNLIHRKYEGAPPPAVAKSADCGGLSECLILIHEIEFDRVDRVTNPQGFKIHYKLKISPDVPQMSRFLETCQQGSIAVATPGTPENKSPRFLITFCESILNFLPGDKPPEKKDPVSESRH